MSPAAARRLGRAGRYICRECGVRQARFRYRGEVRADLHHNLCFQCFRAEANRQRAQRIEVRDRAIAKQAEARRCGCVKSDTEAQGS